MSLARETKDLLKKYGVTRNKRLGQNFLINQSAITALVESADISRGDTVVEVGPGTGIITKELAKHAGRVIAVEKDERLIPLLQDELKEFSNVEIIRGDILEFEPTTYNLKPNTYKLVSAPPYYLTARLFRHFLEELENKPTLIALIIQKEVAKKIVAKPPKSNLLALSVQLYGEPRVEKIIRKGSFLPQPKVDSALLTVRDIQKPDIDERAFFSLVKAGFSSPRKQLATNLTRIFGFSHQKTTDWLKKTDIDPVRRAQTLSLKEWEDLSRDIKA